ncbi:MAG: hypothetical protein WCD35_11005 [Mycobacteriales bacterium]
MIVLGAVLAWCALSCLAVVLVAALCRGGRAEDEVHVARAAVTLPAPRTAPAPAQEGVLRS